MTADLPFVHLRVHTTYSLSEGAIRIKDLVRRCADKRMPAVAMTDTHNLFGGMEFSLSMAKAGIQPIIGCQLAVEPPAPSSGPGIRGNGPAPRDSVVVLVQNETGYLNLLAMLARSFERCPGDARPSIDIPMLTGHADGLILLSGGPDGPVGRLFLDNKAAAAEDLLADLARAFPERFYVEILRHGLDREAAIEGAMLAAADRIGLPIVATNDAYFLDPDTYDAHDALLCIAEGKSVAERERRRVTTEHCLKDPAEMRALFSDLPDAIDNTALIARRCTFLLEGRKPMLPAYDLGAVDEDEALRRDARAGLDKRLAQIGLADAAPDTGDGSRAAVYRRRLDYELHVICTMGFAGYFLIVAEFIRWAKEQSIPVGPGRGSGAGSVVAWSLTITDLDPLRFGLLFERFLNPERVSMPDFDIDFCQDRRDEVIRHVVERYGHDRTAQIITFGKLQARAVLRDVGRVLGMAYGYVDKICKLIPFNPAHPPTLEEAIAAEPQLRELIASDEAVARLIDIARPLEGLYRHASTHAAGVVIADRPLVELIPLYRDPRSEMLVTGFNMKWVEEAGLVKFDFLGLKTLTILADAVTLVREGRGETIDLSTLPFDDAATYDLLGRGETVGVFQLESAGMRDVLRKLKPDSFEDIIAVVALYRPGPMDNIRSYIRRKHGEEQPDYLHPALEEALRETYGIIIYQEQVMQIAQILAGYTLGSADILRRAMGKKIQAEMDKQRAIFAEGAEALGVDKGTAAHIFELVNKFAGYGFNKSHAAAYALVAYQTAYMKANHPVEFFAALMTHDAGSTEKLNLFRQELDRLGIALLPPDINRSAVSFAVENAADNNGAGTAAIRYALSAIRNVGTPAVTAIVEERRANGPFASLDDFAARVDSRHLNRRHLENLIRAGCFDSLNPNRRQVCEGAERIVRAAALSSDARASGQLGLFGAAAGSNDLQLPEVADWTAVDRLKEELEAIGFYLSAHPLDAHRRRLSRLGVVSVADVTASRRPGTVKLAGTVLARTERTSGKGNRFAFLQLSDTSGLFEVVVFADVLSARGAILGVGASVFVDANVTFADDQARFTVNSVQPLDDVVHAIGSDVEILIDSEKALDDLGRLLDEAERGADPVRLALWLDVQTEVTLDLPIHCRADPALLTRLEAIPGVREIRAE